MSMMAEVGQFEVDDWAAPLYEQAAEPLVYGVASQSGILDLRLSIEHAGKRFEATAIFNHRPLVSFHYWIQHRIPATGARAVDPGYFQLGAVNELSEEQESLSLDDDDFLPVQRAIYTERFKMVARLVQRAIKCDLVENESMFKVVAHGAVGNNEVEQWQNFGLQIVDSQPASGDHTRYLLICTIGHFLEAVLQSGQLNSYMKVAVNGLVSGVLSANSQSGLSPVMLSKIRSKMLWYVSDATTQAEVDNRIDELDGLVAAAKYIEDTLAKAARLRGQLYTVDIWKWLARWTTATRKHDLSGWITQEEVDEAAGELETAKRERAAMVEWTPLGRGDDDGASSGTVATLPAPPIIEEEEEASDIQVVLSASSSPARTPDMQRNTVIDLTGDSSESTVDSPPWWFNKEIENLPPKRIRRVVNWRD